MKNYLNYFVLIILISCLNPNFSFSQCVIDDLTVLCNGGSEVLNVPAITSGATWTITNSGTPSRASFHPTDQSVVTSLETNPTIYYHSTGFFSLNATATGCSAVKNNLFIGAEAFINVSPGMTELTLCENEIISLSGVTSGNNNGTETYQWAQVDGDATVSFERPTEQNTNMTSVDAGPSGTGTATVRLTYTDGNGCSGFFDRVYTIYDEVAAAIGNGVTADVCENANLQLDGVPTGGNGIFEHEWTLIQPPIDVSLILDDPEAEDPVLTPQAGAQDGTEYVLSYTAIPDDGNCDNATSETITVTVRVAPEDATLSHAGNNISCQSGAPVALQVDITDDLGFTVSGEFTVELNDGTIVNNYTSGEDIIVNPSVTTTYLLVSVTDAINCDPTSLSGSETITIDDASPVITNCGNITVNTDEGVCDAFVTIGSRNVNDACEIVSLTNDRTNADNANDTYPKGTTVITWTATDLAGNQGTCQQNIIVEDNEDPTFVCGNQEVGTDMDQCAATYTDTESEFADNCAIGSISYRFNNDGAFIEGRPEGVMLELGNTDITYRIEDEDGNSVDCSFTITVEDDDPPIFVDAPNRVTTTTTSACGGEIPDLRSIMITENCPDNLTVTQSPTQGSSFGSAHGEEVEVVVTADDGVNQTTHTVTVVLEDDDAPEITTNCASLNQTAAANPISCNGNVTIGVPESTDNCGVVATINDYNGGTDASGPYPTGQTTITWTVTDVGGNTATCQTVITVADNVPPNLNCPDVTVGTDEGTCETAFFDTFSTLADNCAVESVAWEYPDPVLPPPFTRSGTGKLAGQESFPEGDTEITYTVTDDSNNETECTFTLTVVDDDAPEISGNTEDRIEDATSGCEAEVGNYVGDFSGSDNCGGSVTITQAPAPGTTFIGSIAVTITAEDSEGNMSFITLNAISNGASLTCPSDVSDVADAGVCEKLVTVEQLMVSDNCGAAIVTNDFNNTDDASGTYPVGETIVNWTVTFPNGSAQCLTTITIDDNENPTLVCEDMTISTDMDDCVATFTDVFTSLTDNCGINEEDIQYSYPNTLPGPIFNQTGTGKVENVVLENGTTTNFAYDVTDVNGNNNTCSFNITVEDQVNPVIEGSTDDRLVAEDPGSCMGLVPDLIAELTITDNCDNDLTIVQSPEAGSAFTTSAVVTITATDDNNNSAEVMINIEVDDNVNPNITCPDNIIQDTDIDECSADVTVPAPTPTDNCSVASFSNDFNGTQDASGTYNMGMTTVTWSVTDASGNQNSCSFTVTVNDKQKPVPVCKNYSFELDENLMGSIMASDVFDGASDNCTDAGLLNGTLTISKTDFDETDEGTQNVVLSVTDESNNKGNCSAMVTVTLPPLGIELLNFTASKLDEKTAILEWITLTEQNNKGFDIQRSNNGLDWEDIDFVQGQGNSNERQAYEFIDKKPVSGKNFYRLQQRDENGKTSLSNVVILEFEQLGNSVTVYPNPADELLQVELDFPSENTIIRVFNNTGKLVLTEQRTNDKITTLEINQLPKGIYFMHILVDEESFLEKIVVQ